MIGREEEPPVGEGKGLPVAEWWQTKVESFSYFTPGDGSESDKDTPRGVGEGGVEIISAVLDFLWSRFVFWRGAVNDCSDEAIMECKPIGGVGRGRLVCETKSV